jgi:uncharacterized protein YigE (DUF2233 family)
MGVHCLLLLFLCSTVQPAFASHWTEPAPGVAYQDLNHSALQPWSHIHVFRIDLHRNALELVMAKDLSHRLASADEFAQHSHALIALNGGFFDEHAHPIGLRVNHQREQNPLKKISWWGIFYIQGEQAYLKKILRYHPVQKPDFALQTGPRLIINGQIPKLKPGFAERSALGITQSGEVIILVTENAPMTTTMLAHHMQSPPLNCVQALNLDGGSSSQLYAHMGDFHINDHGLSNVSDAIVVKPVIAPNQT